MSPAPIDESCVASRGPTPLRPNFCKPGRGKSSFRRKPISGTQVVRTCGRRSSPLKREGRHCPGGTDLAWRRSAYGHRLRSVAVARIRVGDMLNWASRTRTKKSSTSLIWSDFLAPDTLASFEELTGIKVNVSYFDTNETLEARMLTGISGFDVVAPVAPYFQREIRSGAYLTLDKEQLPNLVDLDPELMSRVALNGPGNVHGVVYTWATFGIGYMRHEHPRHACRGDAAGADILGRESQRTESARSR